MHGRHDVSNQWKLADKIILNIVNSSKWNKPYMHPWTKALPDLITARRRTPERRGTDARKLKFNIFHCKSLVKNDLASLGLTKWPPFCIWYSQVHFEMSIVFLFKCHLMFAWHPNWQQFITDSDIALMLIKRQRMLFNMLFKAADAV